MYYDGWTQFPEHEPDFLDDLAKIQESDPYTIGDWAWKVAMILVGKMVDSVPRSEPCNICLEGDQECWELAHLIQGVLVDHSDVPPPLPAILPEPGE